MSALRGGARPLKPRAMSLELPDHRQRGKRTKPAKPPTANGPKIPRPKLFLPLQQFRPELRERRTSGRTRDRFSLPVCTENSVLIDYVTDSPNVSGDDRAALLLPDPVRLWAKTPTVPAVSEVLKRERQ